MKNKCLYVVSLVFLLHKAVAAHASEAGTDVTEEADRENAEAGQWRLEHVPFRFLSALLWIPDLYKKNPKLALEIIRELAREENRQCYLPPALVMVAGSLRQALAIAQATVETEQHDLQNVIKEFDNNAEIQALLAEANQAEECLREALTQHT